MQIAAIALLSFAVAFVIISILKRNLKTHEEDDEVVEPAKPTAFNAKSGKPDAYVTGCHFVIGLLGPPRPAMSDNDQPQPEPYIAVDFECNTDDLPNSVSCSLHLADVMSADERLCTGGESRLVSFRNGSKLKISAHIPLSAEPELIEKIKSALGARLSIPVSLQYTLVLNGVSTEASLLTSLTYPSPVDDEDISQYMATYR